MKRLLASCSNWIRMNLYGKLSNRCKADALLVKLYLNFVDVEKSAGDVDLKCIPVRIFVSTLSSLSLDLAVGFHCTILPFLLRFRNFASNPIQM